VRRVLVVLLLACTACTSDGDDAASAPSTTSTSTSAPGTTSTSTSIVEPPRAPVPVNTSACSGDPPFRPSYLPPGFGALQKHARPAGDGSGGEPYDPHFHYFGPAEARIDVYHGNSWRLTAHSLVRELQVMGRTGWLSRYDGHSLIDFPVGSSPGPCDYWALGEEGITEAELLGVAASLAPA
jgi:hypothetical protein